MSPKLFIPIFLILFSCKTDQNQVIYLSKAEMAEILSEMEIAQAAYKFQNGAQQFNLEFMFDEIYMKNITTKEVFYSSLIYYSKSPKEMDEIYNETVNNITQKQLQVVGK